MKKLCGLMFLVVSVLLGGVLVAPPPSDAVNATLPTITITVLTTKGNQTTTLQVDNGSNSGKLYPATNATFSACPSGFNYCFGLHTYGNDTSMEFGSSDRTRMFRVRNLSGAQLQISDNPGGSTNPLNKMILTGVSFVPVCPALSATEPCPSANWPNTEQATLIILVDHKFDAHPDTAAPVGLDPNNVTTYGNPISSFFLYGITAGGNINSTYSAVGDIAQIYGKGTFVTKAADGTPFAGQPKNIYNDVNPDADNLDVAVDLDPVVNALACIETVNHVPPESPLCRTVASPPGTISFSYGQSGDSTLIPPKYWPGDSHSTPSTQRFGCTNNLTGNNKSVTDPKNNSQLYNDPSCQPKVTLTHRFTLKGPDTVNFTASSHEGFGVCGDDKKDKLPSCNCGDNGSLCNAIGTYMKEENQKEKDQQGGINESHPCATDTCNGELMNVFTLSPKPNIKTEFPFLASGSRVNNFTVVFNAGDTSETGPSFTGLITGDVGADILIDADYANWPRPDDKSWYQVDQINVTLPDGTPVVEPFVFVGSCPPGLKGPFLSHILNGKYIATWHLHNSQKPPVSCPVPEVPPLPQ